MDTTKSSEPTKKKIRWLKSSKISDEIADSNSDVLESGTVTAEEEPLLQEKCASAQSCYTECSCALVTQPQFTQCLWWWWWWWWQTGQAPSTDTTVTNKLMPSTALSPSEQCCTQLAWGARGKVSEALHIDDSSTFSCHILWKLSHCRWWTLPTTITIT